MNAVMEMISKAGGAFVGFALPMLIQSSVLIVILLLIDTVLRRRVRAVFRYWLWMLVLVKLMLPPSLGSPVSIGRWLGDPSKTTTPVLSEFSEPRSVAPAAESRSVTESVLSQGVPAFVVAPPAPVEDPHPQAGMQTDAAWADMGSESLPGSQAIPSAAAPVPSLSWPGFVFLSWAVIAAALLLLLIQRSFFVRGLVAQAEEPGAAMQTALDHCRTRIGLRRKVMLKLSAVTGSPAACRLFRPVILIPQSLAPRLEANDLQAVLFHELAHIKRGDLWINLAQTLLQIVYFYNPLLWLANAIIRRTREQAVDEAVLVAMGEAAQRYPETLVSVAKLAFRKRPALSLRLIGVVESKSALSARIKHILTRPLPKTAKLGLVGLLALSIIAVVLLPMAERLEPHATEVNDGPLDIHLVAVCPDGGDEFYDPDGKKLDFTIGPLGGSDGPWKSDEQHRDFILQVPAFDGQLLFPSVVWIRAAGTGSVLGASPPLHNPAISPSSLIISAEFDRTYLRSWFDLFPRDLPVEKVDLTLQYFYGARGQAICTFTGPFTEGKVAQADEGRLYQLTREPVSSWTESQVKFRFTTNQPLASGVPILLHDKQGRRHRVNENGDIGPQGAKLTCETDAVLWDQIVAITVGEKPHEIAFRNVVVKYPNRPARTYAVSWDRMAQRLGRTGSSAETLIQDGFRSADEAIAVLDVIRSLDQIRRAMTAIGQSRRRVDLSALNEATRDKVRRVAASWLESPSMEVRACGVELGLMAGFPEFLDPALALLDYHDPAGPGWTYGLRSRVLAGLQRYVDKATPADIDRLRPLALRGGDGALWNGLVGQCLRMSRQPAVSEMLWELAQDDRPWLWWPCTKALQERHDKRLKAYSDLPEPMKLHLFLASDTPPPIDEALAAQAKALVPGLLTMETLRMYPYGWRDYHGAVARHLAHREATAVYIDFLKELSEPAARWRFGREHSSNNGLYALAPALVRHINFWYGVNLGGLGVYDPDNPAHASSVGPSPDVLAQLIADTLSWYEANQERQPEDEAFDGRTVNTPGGPLAESTEIDATKDAPAEGPSQTVAQLPNGARVELLGLFSGPDVNDLQWWYPDGAPIPVEQAAQLRKRLGSVPSPQAAPELYDFGYLLEANAPEGTTIRTSPSLKSQLGSGRLYDGSTSQLYVCYVWRDQLKGKFLLPQATDIQVVPAFGPYKRLEAEYDSEKGFTRLQDGGGARADDNVSPAMDRSGWCRALTRYTNEDYVPVPDQPLVIGRCFSPKIAPFHGEIAAIRIWSKALADGEAHWYGSMSLTGNEPNLVACWDFERQPGGQIVYDISPNGNHAYLGTSNEKDDADPTWVAVPGEPQPQEAKRQDEAAVGDAPSVQQQDALKHLIDEAPPSGIVTIPKGRYATPVEIMKPGVLRGQSQEECVIEVTADQLLYEETAAARRR